MNMPKEGRVVKMTLKSHPGKALTRDPRDKEMYEGHEVRWYRLGDAADACIFFFVKEPHGKEKDQGEVIRLSEDFNHAMDCCEGQFHEGNDVLSWRAH